MKLNLLFTLVAASALVSATSPSDPGSSRKPINKKPVEKEPLKEDIVDYQDWIPELPPLTEDLFNAADHLRRNHKEMYLEDVVPGCDSPRGLIVDDNFISRIEQENGGIKPVPGARITEAQLKETEDKPGCHVLVLYADTGVLAAYGKNETGKPVQAWFTQGDDWSGKIWNFETSPNKRYPSYCNIRLQDPTKYIPYGMMAVGRSAGEYQLMLNRGLFVPAIGYSTMIADNKDSGLNGGKKG